ncbi:MAG: hypothetical protein IPP51_11125 [Bacteroidetes bacterium]|nr:hypothetical protein [Bacteroidota bacterium]
MDTTKSVTDVLLYFVPALLVMMGMYLVIKRTLDSHTLTLRKFLEKDMHMKSAEDKSIKQRESLPLKLQSYERLVLFLERIAPNSILVRVHRGGMAASQLQSDLVATIRAEFEHNLSQQIYVSEQAWDEVKTAKEDMIRIINNAFSHVGNNASGIQMSSQIFEQILKMEMLPTQKAIDYLKSEAKKLIG